MNNKEALEALERNEPNIIDHDYLMIKAARLEKALSILDTALDGNG